MYNLQCVTLEELCKSIDDYLKFLLLAVTQNVVRYRLHLNCKMLDVGGGGGGGAGPPGAERGPGASSNMTDFRFCEVQNGRRKCRSFVRNMM